ncbi:MAG: methyltransferase [Terriglobia bacterium]
MDIGGDLDREVNPQAQIVALDWPAVLEVAKTNASKAGMDGRFHTLPGSAFETEFAGEYEIVLLTNFLHHFDQETCKGLIGKIRKSISKGGRTLTVEFVPNEDRVSPPVAASFAMMMLGTTASGDAYTFSEYEQMFREGGFSRSELHTVPNAPQSVIVSYA